MLEMGWFRFTGVRVTMVRVSWEEWLSMTWVTWPLSPLLTSSLLVTTVSAPVWRWGAEPAPGAGTPPQAPTVDEAAAPPTSPDPPSHLVINTGNYLKAYALISLLWRQAHDYVLFQIVQCVLISVLSVLLITQLQTVSSLQQLQHPGQVHHHHHHHH